MSNLPDWVNDKRGIGKQSPEDRIKWLEERVAKLEQQIAQPMPLKLTSSVDKAAKKKSSCC